VVTGLSRTDERAVISMLDAGVPVLTAPPATRADGTEFTFMRWRHARVRRDVLDRWRPGWMLAACAGIAFDVIDVDPRNGGSDTLRELRGALPPVAAVVSTPGGGHHLYVAPTGAKRVSAGGIDYLGVGSLVYLPGCSRPKYEGAGYSWVAPLDWGLLDVGHDSFHSALCNTPTPTPPTPPARVVTARPKPPPPAGVVGPRGSSYGRAVLLREADRVGAARAGQRNSQLNSAAFRCGQLVAAGHLSQVAIMEMLMDAAAECGLLRDDGETGCRATIRSGLSAGAARPRGDGAQHG
jgi:hypothetical protein